MPASGRAGFPGTTGCRWRRLLSCQGTIRCQAPENERRSKNPQMRLPFSTTCRQHHQPERLPGIGCGFGPGLRFHHPHSITAHQSQIVHVEIRVAGIAYPRQFL